MPPRSRLSCPAVFVRVRVFALSARWSWLPVDPVPVTSASLLMRLQLNDLADVHGVVIRGGLITNDGRPVGLRRAVTDTAAPSLLRQAALDARTRAEKARASRPAVDAPRV